MSDNRSFLDDAKRVFANDKDKAYGDTYLSNIRESWEKSIDSIGRDFIAIVALIGLFELLVESVAVKFTVAGIEIDNLAVIRAFLPCLIAYFSYDVTVRYASEMIYDKMFHSAMKVLYPELENSMLMPGMVPNRQPIIGFGYSKTSDRFAYTIIWLLITGPPLYLIYAYIIQIVKFSLTFPVIFSATISLFFIVYALIILVGIFNADDERLSTAIS